MKDCIEFNVKFIKINFESQPSNNLFMLTEIFNFKDTKKKCINTSIYGNTYNLRVSIQHYLRRIYNIWDKDNLYLYIHIIVDAADIKNW